MRKIPVRSGAIQADVLVIGGGVGGMQAALSAAEAGASVVIAEKANTSRSGNGSTGNDHFACYMPSVHGDNFERVILETQDTQIGSGDTRLLRAMLLRSEDVVHKWEEYGIPMKPFGDYVFEGHTLPGRQRYHLKYDGREQKPILTAAARKKGVVILNRVTVTELLTGADGRITGAIGIDTNAEEPEMLVFQTRSVIITAGGADARLFTNGTPAYICNVTHCPANACAAAIAYRAGARLANCDQLGRHASPRYMERAGKATWLGLLSDINGGHIGSFVEKPTREFGDPLINIWPSVFQMRMKDGSGPTYMDCTEMSAEDQEYMRYCFGTEGLSSLTDYFRQKNIQLEKDMIEFSSTGLRLAKGGIEIGTDAQSSVPGLFASGNIVGNASGGITCAAVFGAIAGESAAAFAKTADFRPVPEDPRVSERRSFYETLLNRENGANWKEANTMLAQIMQDYLGGELKSESMMTAGLKYLRDLRRMALEELQAVNSHELMRTVEVLDLMDMGEIAFLCVMERRETRGAMKRSDYKYTNPMLAGKMETIEKINGEPSVKFRGFWKK